MKQFKSIRMMVLVVLTIMSLGYWTVTTEAAPISYQFSSTAASGGITQDAAGSITIADLQSVGFVVSIAGDTLNVVDDPLNPGNGWANIGLTGTISISGIDPVTLLPISFAGSFVDPLTVWVDNVDQWIGFDNDTLGLTLLGLYAANVGLDTYDLRSSFGPIAADSIFAFEQFAAIPTSFGFLTIETVDNATFKTPEPASMLLLGFSLLGFVGLRRKFKGN
jgi:hypothetical protein